MLLQSTNGRHRILARSAQGLRARGGYEVDLEWKDGALTQAVVRGISNEPGKVGVRCGKGTSTLTLDKGQSRVLRPGDLGAEK